MDWSLDLRHEKVNDLPHDVFCHIAIYADDITVLYVWSNIWSLATAKMTPEFASDLGDTWAGSGLLISMLEKFKIQKIRLTDLIRLVPLMWKWMGLVLRKLPFKMLVWLSLLN